MSPSDLKQLKAPQIDADQQAASTLVLFSIADDRSGVPYQEYRCVYGEDAETALRFVFNAMASTPRGTDHFCSPELTQRVRIGLWSVGEIGRYPNETAADGSQHSTD